MSETVALLAKSLKAWEDLALVQEATTRSRIALGLEKAQDFRGIPKHWRELRNHLLEIRGGDFDLDRFYSKDMYAYSTLPLQLASWTLSSRRVFQLTTELCKKFAEADYGKLTWSDLLWPFDAFAVQMQEPYEIEQHWECKLQMLLVTSLFNVCPAHEYSDKDGFEIRGFFVGKGFGDAGSNILSSTERAGIEKAMRLKRWGKLTEKLNSHLEEFQFQLEFDMHMPPGWSEPSVIKKNTPIPIDSVSKIVAGLCLYLESLPAGMAQEQGWKKAAPVKLTQEVRGIITDGELVCDVEGFQALSPQTLASFPQLPRKEPGYTVSPHWRRAHYRRRRGEGKNPNAPRDVKIEALFVHKDKMPPGSVPGGSQTSIK